MTALHQSIIAMQHAGGKMPSLRRLASAQLTQAYGRR